jgi:cytochrome c oxidase assembly protein subunit 15
VLTACAGLLTVAFGGRVTNNDAGMADPEGYRAPQDVAAVSLGEGGLPLVIEHRHRLAGFVVGAWAIVLAVGLWFGARRQPYRSLGLLALAAVSLQGVLGIYRVNLERALGHVVGLWLAALHGCFAQLVFAALVAVAVLTSRAWAAGAGRAEGADRQRRLGLALVGVVYAQIVFGAVVRHLYDRLAQRAHVLLAFAAVLLGAWLVQELWQSGRADRALRRTALVLAALLVIQPVLGVEAWLRRFGAMTWPGSVRPTPALEWVRSGHHVVGTLLFATTVALALLLYRSTRSAVALQPAPHPARLEGAA